MDTKKVIMFLASAVEKLARSRLVDTNGCESLVKDAVKRGD